MVKQSSKEHNQKSTFKKFSHIQVIWESDQEPLEIRLYWISLRVRNFGMRFRESERNIDLYLLTCDLDFKFDLPFSDFDLIQIFEVDYFLSRIRYKYFLIRYLNYHLIGKFHHLNITKSWTISKVDIRFYCCNGWNN